MQVYDITVPTNGAAFQVAAQGKFLYYLAGSAGGSDATLKVRAGLSGQTFLLKPGQAVRLADDDKAVDTWYLSTYAANQAILGRVLVGNGDFTDNTISGSVEVVDGGKNRTLANAAFAPYANAQQTAGNRAVVGLSNPANSGVRVIIKATVVSVTAAMFVGLAPAPVGFGGLASNAQSKLIGGAAGKCEVRTVVQAAATGAPNLVGGYLTANATIAFVFQEPFILLPGQAIAWNSLDTSAGPVLTASFETVEEVIPT